MSDIRRSLEAMEIDEDMRAVVLKTKKNEVFSMGTDLNYLYYKKKSGELEKIDEYYQNLYNFHNFIASYHKPLICIGGGIASKIYLIC
jgi:enoyl-CoA hydratase/carnithine racemase